jgi:Rps23 Pro-64 3,4-dihydroxylase Tpa1-like proline 4-hydroxylase
MAMIQCNQLDSNILYFTGVIENPYEYISILEDTENNKDYELVISPWEKWNSSYSDDPSDIYEYGLRKRIIPQEIDNLNPLIKENALYLIDTIQNATIYARNEYKKINNIQDSIYGYVNFNIQKYKTGTMMGPHHDTQDGDSTLKYSLVTYLNDDYEGGELEFPNHGIKIKPEAGSIIIFPSSQPYLHVSHNIKSGWKYMSPTFWLNKPEHSNEQTSHIKEYNV